jgi:Uri superfamily endonuclease
MGTYCLVVQLGENKNIQIGKLGNLYFQQGTYIYVGSALKNMEKRLQRHMRKEKKLFWHIDYFLQFASIIDILRISSPEKLECKIAHLILNLPFSQPIPRFGCSDCSCLSHLFYFPGYHKKIEENTKK